VIGHPNPPNQFWDDVHQNHWYRMSSTFDLVSNRVIGISLTDMDTGVTQWQLAPYADGSGGTFEMYLAGGPNNFQGRFQPTGIRIMAGAGGTPVRDGNQVGWDNVRISQGMQSVPNEVTIQPGNPGGAADARLLYEDDSQRLDARPGVVLTSSQPPLVFNLKFTAPKKNPALLRLTIDGHATAPIARTVEFKRAGTTTYDTIGSTENLAINTDAEASVSTSTSPSQYVDQATGLVEARIRCRAAGAVLIYPWRVRLDKVWLGGR
jgi:hypothetical protein